MGALARVGLEDGPLGAIAEAATAMMPDADTRCVAHIACAFAALGLKDAKLFDAVAAEVLERPKAFHGEALSGIRWAFEELGFEHKPLLSALSAWSIKPLEFGRPGSGTSAVAREASEEPRASVAPGPSDGDDAVSTGEEAQ